MAFGLCASIDKMGASPDIVGVDDNDFRHRRALLYPRYRVAESEARRAAFAAGGRLCASAAPIG
jgi:hypothetical protein